MKRTSARIFSKDSGLTHSGRNIKNALGAPTLLRIGFTDPIAAIDPRSLAEVATILLARQVFEGPYAASTQGDAVGQLFSEPLSAVTASAGVQYRAPLRPGVRFSDGAKLDPSEVVAALQHDPTFSSRASAELRGSDSVLLTLREPNARFDLFLTLCGLVHRTTPDGFIGTGPYRVDGAYGGNFVRLVASDYARVPPPISVIEARVFPPSPGGRPDALLAALEKGEVDLAPRLSWRDIQSLKSSAAVLKPVNSTCIFYLNCDRLPDPRVRRAAALAIDRQEVAQVAFGDNPLAFRATGLLPPALGKCHDGNAPDPARARALLQDAGGFKGAVTIIYAPAPRPYLPLPSAVARHLRDRLRRVGFSVEAEELASSASLVERLNTGNYDLALMGNVPDGPDPADFLSTVLGSDAIPSSVEGTSFCFNFSRYRNAAFDVELAEYRRSRNPETLANLGRMIGQESPLVPLLYGRACVAHNWRLKGWEATVTGLADFSKLTFR